MGRSPFCTASTAVARTQPLVVQPVMIKVSACRLTSLDTRSVPKKHEAYFLTSRISLGPKVEARIDVNQVGPGLEGDHPFLLQRPYSGVT